MNRRTSVRAGVPVNVSIATGRGVAERWRLQYLQTEKYYQGATPQVSDAQKTYEALLALGDCPEVEAVDAVVGNKSWTHIFCDGCATYQRETVHFTAGTGDIDICRLCLVSGLGALGQVLSL